MPTASPALRRLATTRPDDGPCLDLVVPAHDAAHVLAEHITTLHLELMAHFPFTWRITIVDSASTDGTWWIARHLAVDLPQVRAMRVAEAGHGRALRAAWAASDAAVLGYVDADLATGLSALLPLVAPLLNGHSDVAIGSRLAPGARVVAGTERDVAARCHSRLLHLALGTRFRDAQCGFKAVRADVARRLLTKVTADGWFFDTELLVRAERDGLHRPTRARARTPPADPPSPRRPRARRGHRSRRSPYRGMTAGDRAAV